MNTVQVLWVILLVVAVLVLPLIVWYLHSVFFAAREIKWYCAEMEKAGAGIVENTEHIKELSQSSDITSEILKTAIEIEENTKQLENLISSRTKQKN